MNPTLEDRIQTLARHIDEQLEALDTVMSSAPNETRRRRPATLAAAALVVVSGSVGVWAYAGRSVEPGTRATAAPAEEMWMDGAALTIQFEHGADPTAVESVREALAAWPAVIDVGRMRYLDEAQALARLETTFADRPDEIRGLTLDNIRSMLMVFAEGTTQDGDVIELVNRLDIKRYAGVAMIVTPSP